MYKGENFLSVPKNAREIVLNTPNRNEILKAGPPSNANENLLGKGAFGTVLKGIFKERQVAVKIVRNLDDSNLQIMHSEANTLGWRHRNIVKILKIEHTPNYGLIIMERFNGYNLQYVLDSIELSLKHRVFVSLDISNALSYCHAQRVLHLDVKPQNVMVTFDDRHAVQNGKPKRRAYICKLCDFGSSMKVSDKPMSLSPKKSVRTGTVRYMSVEMIRNGNITPAADIYSLGILMWQLKCRRIPYSHITSNEVVAYQVVKFDLRPDCSEDSKTYPKSRVTTFNQHNSQELKCCGDESKTLHFESLNAIKALISKSDFQSVNSPKFLTPKKPDLSRVSKRFLFTESADISPASFHKQTCDSLKLFSMFHDAHVKSKEPQDNQKERLYVELYKSCWQTAAYQRPTAVELRNKLRIIFT